MSFVNYATKEINCKVLYYGTGLGGKTTNIQFVYDQTQPDRKGKLVTMSTENERTLFFDFLPLSVGEVRGYKTRFHLYTIPGQTFYEVSRQFIIKGVDGIVFVVDSDPDRMEANLDSFGELERNLEKQGYDLARIPLVLQYNKRDLPGVASIRDLRLGLGVPRGVPEVEAIATRGIGVLETMKTVLRECLQLVGDPRTAREGRSPSILPGKRASMFPGRAPAVAPALPGVPRIPTGFGND